MNVLMFAVAVRSIRNKTRVKQLNYSFKICGTNWMNIQPQKLSATKEASPVKESSYTKPSTYFKIEEETHKSQETKQIPVVIVRNRSWPAVSQICNLILFPSSSIVLILKSMLPMRKC